MHEFIRSATPAGPRCVTMGARARTTTGNIAAVDPRINRRKGGPRSSSQARGVKPGRHKDLRPPRPRQTRRMTTAPRRRENAARRSAATVENGAREEAHRRHHAADVCWHAIVLHPSQAINPRRSLHAASKRRRSLLRPPRPRTKTAYQQALQTTGRRIQMIWGRSTDAEDAGEQRVLENRGCEQWGACPSHIRSRPKPPKWRRNGDRTT